MWGSLAVRGYPFTLHHHRHQGQNWGPLDIGWADHHWGKGAWTESGQGGIEGREGDQAGRGIEEWEGEWTGKDRGRASRGMRGRAGREGGEMRGQLNHPSNQVGRC